MEITVYGSNACKACRMLKKWLGEKRVPFEFKEALEHVKELQAIYSKRCKEENKCEIAIPVIKAGEKTIIGFNKRELEKWF